MPQADALRSRISTAAKQKYLAEIAKLTADAREIQQLQGCMDVETVERYACTDDGVLTRTEVRDGQMTYAAVEKVAIKRSEEFGTNVRRLIRIFHDELPDAALACVDTQMIQLFTDNQAEGERLLGRFWITGIWDGELGDPIDRRCGIDLQAIRDAAAWLDILSAKLELNSGGSRVLKNDSPTLNLISEAIRPFKGTDVSCEEICKRLDKKEIPRPPGARWRELTWWSAWKSRKYRRTVESRVNKFKNA